MATMCNDGCHIICDFCVYLFKQESDNEVNQSLCTKHKQVVSWTYGCTDYFCKNSATNEMKAKVEQEIERPEPGAIYQNWKTKGFYQVLAIGKHTETQEEMVIYSGADHQTWIRPLTNWVEEKVVNGSKVPRFRLLSEEELADLFE